MTTRTESLSFDTAGGATDAFVAMPEGETERAVILIHEWWGLNDHIKDIAERYAAEGFIAIAPEGNQPMTSYYEDLRPVDGVMVAHRIRTQTPSFEIILTSTEVKHNLLIDDSKFARPKI